MKNEMLEDLKKWLKDSVGEEDGRMLTIKLDGSSHWFEVKKSGEGFEWFWRSATFVDVEGKAWDTEKGVINAFERMLRFVGGEHKYIKKEE